LFFHRLHGINRPPVHGDSVIATISAGTDFNSVSRNADASDLTTLDTVVAEAALPMTNKLSCRTGDFVDAMVEQPRGLVVDHTDIVERRDHSRVALMPAAGRVATFIRAA
jgi:hypothetical protein